MSVLYGDFNPQTAGGGGGLCPMKIKKAKYPQPNVRLSSFQFVRCLEPYLKNESIWIMKVPWQAFFYKGTLKLALQSPFGAPFGGP